MSSFKCYTCDLTYPSRNSLSKHIFKCLGAVKDVLVIAKNINFSNLVQNNNLKSNIENLSNDDNLSENLADISFELEDNTYSKNLEVGPNTNILDEFENTSQGFRELSDDISVSTDYFEDIENNSSNDENQEYNDFSNKAYADLIVLVTKYKLSNAARNAIISFFNKHSNYSKSPLPKILNKKNYL
ncbi:zn-finger domain-containing protein [Gigaspora margarita]|uniref:Zn-finger domain-containing protein n=1 Tax=Gigaspora margarita TaxID=4874 RepID=A0A8H4B2L8_GIGMA|nr:zn-finger domain-containing protein [Gigaspora margarita]